MFSPLCTNLSVCSRKLRVGEWSWGKRSSSPGREDSTKITSSSFTKNYLSFYRSVVCRQIAYYFSRKLTACFKSSLLCKLFVFISSCSVPNFIWAILCQSKVFSAAFMCKFYYGSVPKVLHFRVRKADSHLGFILILLLLCA